MSRSRAGKASRRRSQTEDAPPPAAVDPRVPRAAALLLALAAAALAAFLSQDLFAGRPRVGDEVSYALQGRILAAGRLYLPPPAVPEAFSIDNVVLTPDRWCGKYPPGFPLLLAAGWLAGAPWLVNPLLFGLAVLGVFRLGESLYDASTALAGAVLLATLPFAFLQGASFMSHVASLAAAAWCLTLLSKGGTGRVRARLVGAGLLGGFAFLVRPVSALLLLLVPAAVLLVLRFEREARARAAALVLVGGLAPLAFLLFVQWRTFGGPFVSGYSVFDPTEGFLGNRHGSRALAEIFRSNLDWYAEALPAALWAVPGSIALWLAAVLLRPRREDLVPAAAAAGLVSGYLCYYYRDILYGGPRFALEATGFLALLLARGLANLATLPGRAGWRAASRSAAVPATIAVAAAAMLGAATVRRELPKIAAHARNYMGVPNDPMAGADAAGVGPDALVLVDFEDPLRSLSYVGADSPAFSAYLLLGALEPPEGRRVYVRALPDREDELVAAYPRAETWRVVVSLSLPRVREAPMNGPSVLHGLRWSRIR